MARQAAQQVTYDDIEAKDSPSLRADEAEPAGPPYPFPMERSQTDGRGLEYSILTGLDCSQDKVITRQEFKDETDVNNILGRYGINAPLREMRWGAEVDESIDLQQALDLVSKAKAIQVPDELKSKFPTWQSVLQAAETGEYQHALDQLAKQNEEEKARVEREKSDREELEAWRNRTKSETETKPKAP